jgi:hypothetical protein
VLDNFHRHVAQLRIDSAPLAQRPPIVQVDLHWPLHKEYYGSGAEESAPAGITVAWVERDFFTDPGWPLDLLVRVGKLDFGKNQPAIRTLEAIDRPNEAIMIMDLVPDLADDLR